MLRSFSISDFYFQCFFWVGIMPPVCRSAPAFSVYSEPDVLDHLACAHFLERKAAGPPHISQAAAGKGHSVMGLIRPTFIPSFSAVFITFFMILATVPYAATMISAPSRLKVSNSFHYPLSACILPAASGCFLRDLGVYILR